LSDNGGQDLSDTVINIFDLPQWREKRVTAGRLL
jgi:hypothetical protein